MLRRDPIVGHQDASYLVRRGRIWQFRRAVPGELAVLDPRRAIRVTTGTCDRSKAALVAAKINTALEEYWRGLLSSSDVCTATAQATSFTDAVAEARAHNLTYRPAAEIAEQPLADIVARVKIFDRPAAPPTRNMIAAVLGGASKPTLRLSGLFEVYNGLVTDRTLGKSDNQRRKWTATRERAVANLIAMIGDKPIADITRDDALDFKEWWVKRIRDEGYDQTSANKDLGALTKMMRTINDAWRLNLALPFAGIRVADEKHRPRIAYEAEYVRSHILPGDRLPKLNPEARAALQIVAATGMRPREVLGLTRSRIVLDAAIPHLQVRPEQRQLKTDHSARDMPLLGIALTVMTAFSEGFPRYRDAPDVFSATANKALGAAGLRPTPRHTVYSLRHTFKDRLIALEVPQRIQDELMGHALHEIAYGSGSSLRQRADWLARVWG